MAHSDFSKKPARVPAVSTKYRRIKTAIPAPGTADIFNQLEKYESRSMHGQLPIVWDKAKNFQVFDKRGNCWIDFTSTIFVANAGHANPDVIKAIQTQLKRPLVHTYTFASDIRTQFLKKLVEFTPAFCEKAFLVSSGTEASECALKLMRLYGQQTSPDRVGIISFTGSMHGRTMGAEMLRGRPDSSAWIGHADPNIHHVPFPYPWKHENKGYDWKKHFEKDMHALEKSGVNMKKVIGFAVESYQGWGAILYPKAYIQALTAFAKKHGMLVMFDEIQSGFGRTGKLFCYQHYGVTPDLLCLGKALGSGFPISAVIGRKDILDIPAFGSMSSTHSAQPLGCAAGLATLNYFEKNGLVAEAGRKGKILHKELTKLKMKYPNVIARVLGTGMVAALIIEDTKGAPMSELATRICERAMQKGLLMVHTGRESIKIGPPLTIPDAALIEGVTVIDECLAELVL